MTTKVKEENANPYNEKKSWHSNEEDKPFESADGMFFKEPTKVESNEEVEQPVEQEASEDKPYKRPDYKKRYDDLKKHYDPKIAEFKQREQELRAEAMQAQPSYKPPKSEEELESFKEEYPDLYNTVETVAHIVFLTFSISFTGLVSCKVAILTPSSLMGLVLPR